MEIDLIGIFWISPDGSCFFHAETIDVSEGMMYGDWIISKNDHVYVWEELEETGFLKTLHKRYKDEYYLLPRGRVSFNTINSKYYVYHGNWIKESHKKMIFDRYELNEANTVFEFDKHYVLKF